MKILLDTHIFLWYITDDERLGKDKRELIRSRDNEVFLSVISIWEAIIKNRLGKLPLPQSPELYLPFQRNKHQITSLPLDEKSVLYLGNLPQFHRDPFDRMLICQSQIHQLTLLTDDEIVEKYLSI